MPTLALEKPQTNFTRQEPRVLNTEGQALAGKVLCSVRKIEKYLGNSYVQNELNQAGIHFSILDDECSKESYGYKIKCDDGLTLRLRTKILSKRSIINRKVNNDLIYIGEDPEQLEAEIPEEENQIVERTILGEDAYFTQNNASLIEKNLILINTIIQQYEKDFSKYNNNIRRSVNSLLLGLGHGQLETLMIKNSVSSFLRRNSRYHHYTSKQIRGIVIDNIDRRRVS